MHWILKSQEHTILDKAFAYKIIWNNLAEHLGLIWYYVFGNVHTTFYNVYTQNKSYSRVWMFVVPILGVYNEHKHFTMCIQKVYIMP